MPIHPSEIETADFFRSVGFVATHIPEAATPRPDLLVTGDNIDYLVEVKAKEPSKEWEAALDRGEMALADIAHGTTGAWSSLLRDAEEQLTSYEQDVARLRFVVVDIDLRWQELEHQLTAALLGSRSGIDLRTRTERLIAEVDTPQLARFRRIDGVLVFVGDRVRMFVNHYGARVEATRSSRIAGTLGDAVVDVDACTPASDILRAPPDWRGLSDDEKRERSRRDLGVILARFITHTATTRVTRAADEPT